MAGEGGGIQQQECEGHISLVNKSLCKILRIDSFDALSTILRQQSAQVAKRASRFGGTPRSTRKPKRATGTVAPSVCTKDASMRWWLGAQGSPEAGTNSGISTTGSIDTMVVGPRRMRDASRRELYSSDSAANLLLAESTSGNHKKLRSLSTGTTLAIPPQPAESSDDAAIEWFTTLLDLIETAIAESKSVDSVHDSADSIGVAPGAEGALAALDALDRHARFTIESSALFKS